MAPVATLSRCRVACATKRGGACNAMGERRLAAATCAVAAAVALQTCPAIAGVSLEQPKLKNFNQPAPEQPEKKATADPLNRFKRKDTQNSEDPKPDKKAQPKGPEAPPIAFNTQALWPLGLVAAPAALFAVSKVDPGTAKLFETGWVKDSGQFGIGTEDKLKNKGGYMSPYYEAGYIANAKNQKGTKQIKKSK